MGPKKAKVRKPRSNDDAILKAIAEVRADVKSDIAQVRTDLIKDIAPMFEDIHGCG